MAYTTVVSDTGDFNAIQQFRPQDATTNPSLIAAAAEKPEYQPVVDDVLKQVRKDAGPSASDKEVAATRLQASRSRLRPQDPRHRPRPRLHRSRRSPLLRHRQVHREGARHHRPVRQGRHLPRPRPHQARLHLGRHQGRRDPRERGHPLQHDPALRPPPGHRRAEAKVTLISPFVGRILDWYKKNTGKDYTGADDPGVQSVTTIYNYYKKFGYKTVVMGASFRNIGEITELAGCDLLTIAPKLLDELEATRRRPAAQARSRQRAKLNIEKITIDKATFDKMHAADRMANDKLKEGIEGFSKALEDLEVDPGKASQRDQRTGNRQPANSVQYRLQINRSQLRRPMWPSNCLGSRTTNYPRFLSH